MNSHFQVALEENKNRQSLYFVGGVAAISTILVGLVEIMITFLPGGNVSSDTVFDWFLLFQQNPFMGLRNLGLLNIFFNAFGILTFFSLFAALRRTNQALAALAMIISFIGIAVFFATNRAFAMLAVSNQYTLAITEVQKTLLAGAGQALLAVGQSHTPGTFIAFFLSESAGILMSICMLGSKIFSKTNAIVGILGFGMLLIFEFCASFAFSLQGKVMILAMMGGLLSLFWDILIAKKLFQLSKTGA